MLHSFARRVECSAQFYNVYTFHSGQCEFSFGAASPPPSIPERIMHNSLFPPIYASLDANCKLCANVLVQIYRTNVIGFCKSVRRRCRTAVDAVVADAIMGVRACAHVCVCICERVRVSEFTLVCKHITYVPYVFIAALNSC